MKKRMLSARIRNNLQETYNKKARRAVRHHNKENPQEPWELMEKSRYHKKMVAFTKNDGNEYFNLLAYRVRIKGKRGKGSTFTFTGDMHGTVFGV